MKRVVTYKDDPITPRILYMFFSLDRKEPKDQGRPDRSARSSLPALYLCVTLLLMVTYRCGKELCICIALSMLFLFILRSFRLYQVGGSLYSPCTLLPTWLLVLAENS